MLQLIEPVVGTKCSSEVVDLDPESEGHFLGERRRGILQEKQIWRLQVKCDTYFFGQPCWAKQGTIKIFW